MPENTSAQSLVIAEQYLATKNYALAEVCVYTVLRSDPENSKANELLAYVLGIRGESDTSLNHLVKACSSPEASFQALYSLGSYFLAQRRYAEAAQCFDRSLSKQGEFFNALHDLGLANIGLKRFTDAAKYLRRALDLDPKSYETLNNLGAALRNLGEFSESLKYLDAATEVNPVDASAWLNKGVTFDSKGDFLSALECYNEALRLAPNYLEAICNKANTLFCLGHYSEAEALYERALVLAPQDFDSHYNHALLCLLQGNFEVGWEKYEARWHSIDALPYPFHQIPALQSIQHLADKKVLVWCEQALGDTIQFCRYIPMLRDLGAKITLLVQPSLAELLKNLDGVENLETEQTKCTVGFDSQIPLMSLPLFFKTDLSNIPANIPYIFPNLEKVKYWKSRIGKSDLLKVGIVWSGGFRKDSPSHWALNNRRNIPFSKIACLQDVEGVEFYSLQKGEPAESEFLKEGAQLWPRENLVNFAPMLNDFSDTAGLIANLDLLITVDTSTAHLAAAMGKPVWVLNRFDACWRWLKGRSDSPWYPTVRLYKQLNSGDWSEVVKRVARDLTELSAKNPLLDKNPKL